MTRSIRVAISLLIVTCMTLQAPAAALAVPAASTGGGPLDGLTRMWNSLDDAQQSALVTAVGVAALTTVALAAVSFGALPVLAALASAGKLGLAAGLGAGIGQWLAGSLMGMRKSGAFDLPSRGDNPSLLGVSMQRY